MLSDINTFFAEQDEIMGRPQEDFADFLARRQRRTAVCCSFAPQTIEIDYLHSPEPARHSVRRPTAEDHATVPPQGNRIISPDACEPSSRDRSTTSNDVQPSPDSPQDSRATLKRKLEGPGRDLNQRPEKRRRGAEPTSSGSDSAASDRHAVPGRSRTSDAVSVEVVQGGASAPGHGRPTPAQLAPPKTEHRTPHPRGAPKSATAARALSPSPGASREKCLKFPGGGRPSKPSCEAATIEEANSYRDRTPGSKSKSPRPGERPPAEPTSAGGKRPAQGSALGGSLASSTRRRPAAGSSSSSVVATPTSTAAGAVSLAKGVTGKKGKGRATPTPTAQKRVVAARGGSAGRAQKQKGRAAPAERVTAAEYARQKNAEYKGRRASGKTTKDKQFLEGKRIFYYGNDMSFAGEETKRKMGLIARHGGTLVPEYDPEKTTHIVVQDMTSEDRLLKALGLKRLADIPLRIPTVKWSWVETGFYAPRVRASTLRGEGWAPDRAGQEDVGGEGDEEEDPLVYNMGWLYEHAAFSKRIDAGETPWGESISARKNQPASKGLSGIKASRSTDEVAPADSVDDISSSISDFTQDKTAQIARRGGLPSPPSSPSHLNLDVRQPPTSKAAGKGPQAVQPASGSGGPSTHAVAAHVGPPSAGPPLNTLNGDEDPLAEFYPLARAERDAEMFGDDESDTESIPSEKGLGRAAVARHGSREAGKKGVFLCDDKDSSRRLAGCPNQDVIDKLEELKQLHEAKPTDDDRWRVFGLRKAIAALRRYPTRIKSVEEAMKLKGVGEKTARKVMEIIHTGGLVRIKYETTEDIKVVRLLTGIYGVGANTARIWYNNGCKTLDDVAARKHELKLSYAQQIGLKHYADINTRIPRAEVEEIYGKVRATALKIDPKLFIKVMGSFRRGKSTCGDIDVLITRPTDDGKTHRGVLRRLLAELHRKGVVTEDLCLPDDFSDLELVYRGLCRRDSRSMRRRIDFLTVPWSSRGAALLYYTGDDIFNRSLRMKAGKMGYSLNQRGLFADVIRDNERQKVTEGILVASESEREIFDILGVPWQEPHERIRN